MFRATPRLRYRPSRDGAPACVSARHSETQENDATWSGHCRPCSHLSIAAIRCMAEFAAGALAIVILGGQPRANDQGDRLREPRRRCLPDVGPLKSADERRVALPVPAGAEEFDPLNCT